jgi:hypothetical protein
MKEKVIIIGGGYTGSITAVLLSNLKKKNGDKMYDIVLLEKNNNILDGAAKLIDRLHLGGEYPLDKQSALACLEGSIYFKQMFPEAIFSHALVTNYVLAKETQENQELSLESIINNYNILQEHYKTYFKEFSDVYGECQAARMLFGHPDQFYSLITDFSHINGFTGGIKTKEKGINPVIIGAFLELLLLKNEVKIYTNHNVIDALSTPDGFKITTENDEGIQIFYANQVINAAWQNAFSLNQKINKQNNHLDLNIFLRCSAIVDISECPYIPESYFGMLGKYGGSYSPMNKNIAFAYFPDESGSYLGEHKQNNTTPSMPELWEHYIQKGIKDPAIRGQTILEALSNIYPFLHKAKFLRLFARTILSANDKLEKRRYEPIKKIDQEGKWLSALSMKAVFAPTNAIDLVHIIQENSVKDGFIKEREQIHFNRSKSHILPYEFIFPKELIDKKYFVNYAQKYALLRQMPIEMVDDNFIKSNT